MKIVRWVSVLCSQPCEQESNAALQILEIRPVERSSL